MVACVILNEWKADQRLILDPGSAIDIHRTSLKYDTFIN